LSNNDLAYVFAEFDGWRYIGTDNGTDGGQVWRCQACDGRAGDWQQVANSGINDKNNADIEPELVLGTQLFLDTSNWYLPDDGICGTGTEVWRPAEMTLIPIVRRR
jgi:hypothetical protein